MLIRRSLLFKRSTKERREVLNAEIRRNEECRDKYLSMICNRQTEVPYEFVRDALANLEEFFSKNINYEMKKRLLHIIISEITINEKREIDSIKVVLSSQMLQFLSKGGVSEEGAPPSFCITGRMTEIKLDLVV